MNTLKTLAMMLAAVLTAACSSDDEDLPPQGGTPGMRVDLSQMTEDYTAADGDTLTGSLPGGLKLYVANDATVVLSNASVIEMLTEKAGLACEGNATIILADGTVNTFWGYNGCPGIFIPYKRNLYIKGTGTLIAKALGIDGAAGIGGGKGVRSGNIYIEGGNITAWSNSNGAGIGSGWSATCGNITISGGDINAKSFEGGAAVGSGEFGRCGDITITEGMTRLYAVARITYSSMPSLIGAGKKGDSGHIYFYDRETHEKFNTEETVTFQYHRGKITSDSTWFSLDLRHL